ncbi:protein MON2 homolog isoform X1 [Trichogramma pretiosum]|uniref:protein MON2 homolog isoform X1 n=1 Tax=Trichogramma pretiosum TaxID=7493 RepID=UPI0006C98942|nr:protein MON2 homolog isoform X1 [Trichogramma pretiosum]
MSNATPGLAAVAAGPAGVQDNSAKLFESLQADLKVLATETKKKFPQIKEACEESIIKLRQASSINQPGQVYYVVNQILYPLVQGCESKDVKISKLCLNVMQRLITQQAIDQKGARFITDALKTLMEAGIEEVKVLQTVTLLLTSNSLVQGDNLARNLVLCFRLHFTKDSTTCNTAGATVRQLVSLVFERVVAEDEQFSDQPTIDENLEELKIPTSTPPKGLRPCAADAFLMFQDLVQLVNADQPYWLTGIVEMTRTFGLELLESVLTNFSSVFFKHPEFSFLLKERVCALVIKLFSPNIKYRNSVPASVQQATPLDKPYFPISMRLLRVVSILIQKYHFLLVTECEIFLSLIVKFLDPDKPPWQRALALEVLHKMTVQANLLTSFCNCYDLKPHATNIFQDIVNSLGAYIHSLFVNPNMVPSNTGQTAPIAQGTAPAMLAGMPIGPGVTPQPGFYSRGIWLPVVVTFQNGQTKSTYLEMLDKVDPPQIPDGYGISIAYACLLDIIRSIALAIQGPRDDATLPERRYEPSEADRKLHAQLINSSWCGLLAALSPLIDASTDETATENVLKEIQTFASLCGLLELQIPRDAFITAICKASLPPHYALTVLYSAPQGIPSGASAVAKQAPSAGDSAQQVVSSGGQYNPANLAESDYRQQVVAVGTPLPTASLPIGAQQGPVMLTVKNLQCMRALLLLAHCHGSILGSAWHLVLTTLQHLAWILGLKPSTGGSLKAGRTAADSNAMLTTAVMADLPVLSAMLSRLFESSQHLDDVALHHLIDALCKLSQEAMELAYTNREPSLFAVAKLLETGLVNLPRVEVLWRPLTNHLLEVCQHPHIRMREWGVEAITYLVKAALQHKYAQPLRENQKLQTLLLGPLSELSSVRHADVRQRQLECVLQILHGAGETLFHGWPLVLGIIGAVSDHHGEALVRIAFQCLQLVITDFLPAMPWRCLPLCVDTAAKFGSQTQELNISLTAVGQMWNISDYFYHNHEKICASLSGDSASVFPDFPGTTNMSAFDKLWMCLFARLGDLCVDERPAVRKSASQTLFSTISAHGSLLQQPTWQAVLWQVLFPLLDKVRSLSSSASNEKVDTSGNILIHHSRNTAQKQWAETQVLTLSGVSRVFNTKRQLLQLLGDFPRAWSLLLEFVENSALSKNNEVSLAALKSFQEILYVPKSNADINNTDPTQSEDSEALWTIAWRIWLSIGLDSTKPPQENEVEPYIPSQAFLTALVQIFPTVFQHFKNKFTSADLQKLCLVLKYAVAVPVHGESTPYILPTVPDVVLTQLQDGVLHSMELIQKEALSSQENLKFMISPVFLQLLYYSKLACEAPSYGKIPTKHISQVRGVSADWVTMNYVPFGEKALSMVVNLYQKTANEPPVIEAQILKHIIEALHVPLGMKYACPSHTTWKLAVTSLLAILHIGLPLARNHPDSFQSMWQELADTLEHFLFPSNPVNLDRGIEEIQADEAVDCQVMELLRDEVLPHSQNIPQQFVLRVVMLLNKGSIHSATSNIEKSGEPKLREEFAKTCFETLLQFSLLDGLNGDSENINSEAITSAQRDEGGVAGRLAVTALLHRFQEVLKRYVEDERRSGKCPLPRYRLSEISFVLKAVATLVVSLKKAPANKVERSVWEQLIALYPCLVECTVTTSSGAVSRSLREALMQYHDLLHPPGCCTVTNSTNTSSTNSINNNDAPAANGV